MIPKTLWLPTQGIQQGSPIVPWQVHESVKGDLNDGVNEHND